jgi:lysozyme
MPDTQPKSKVKPATALALAATLATTALIAPWEGKRNDPYDDVIRVKTVCYGETRVEMRHYSNNECSAMLNKAVSTDFAVKVQRCSPGIEAEVFPLAAATSLAYNIGIVGYCKSSVARLFNGGNIRGGCNAIGRFVLAGGKRVQGLVNRRAAEVALCLRGVT